MNLKEAFRYQNFLEGILDAASRSIYSSEHCLVVKREHLRNAVNPEAENENEIVKVDEFFSNDDVLKFIEYAITQKTALTEAIGATAYRSTSTLLSPPTSTGRRLARQSE